MRAVLLVLDGMPVRHVRPAITPTLCGLAATGGHAAAGGVAVLCSATYPNHATFATGRDPSSHGLISGWLPRDGRVVPAYDLGPAGDTLFAAARRAGRTSAAAFGDQHLVAVMGARGADTHWPPDGLLPDDTAVDKYGYATDAAALPHLLDAIAADADLTVLHLNEPDTAGHAHGPDSDAAHAVYAATDAAVAMVVDALRPRWADTFLAIVSDHDMVTALDEPAVDLYSPADGRGLTIVPEGDAAVVWGADVAWIRDVDGVTSLTEFGPAWLATTAPGRAFGFGAVGQRGLHGGPATTAQVAIVAGGHPAVAATATELDGRRPNAADWATTFASLLDLDLLGATGRALA